MKIRTIAIALLAFGALLIPAQGAMAAPAPAWHLTATPLPTNFAPGGKGTGLSGPLVLLIATNVGAAPTSGAATLTATLPAGVIPTSTSASGCAIVTQTVTCTHTGPIHPSRQIELMIVVEVDPLAPEEDLTAEAKVEGGGASPLAISVPVSIDSEVAPFGFLPGAAGLSAPFNQEDGGPATQAGSHPHQLTVSLGFPTEKQPASGLGAAGHARDISTDLPPGTIIDPTATPVLCTEAQLISQGDPGCPDASQVGTATVLTVGVVIEGETTPLYNMVPPPGTPAVLAFDALGAGLFPHIVGEVRSDGDFGLSGVSKDSFALPLHPIFGVRIDLWGDPSSESHDEIRSIACYNKPGSSCPVDPQQTAFLTLPGECSGKPSITRAKVNTWEEPSVFKEATYQSADLQGNPVSISGCNQLKFEPTIEARPTTNLTDSPAGLDFTLRHPKTVT